MNYAIKNQYLHKVVNGVSVDIWDKSIVEIGCGHGGISLYMAMNGAKRVVGVDLNTKNLGHARTLKKKFQEKFGMTKDIPVEYVEMNAYDMTLEPGTFDLVFADNVFEHFMEPKKVMEQSFKILKPGGKLIVPSFSSIWSKYALHLKNGLKVPWSNLIFSEKTICNVMVELSKTDESIAVRYPGVVNNPKKVRDLRAYGDLNDITYGRFKLMAEEVGFEVVNFRVNPTPRIFGSILKKTPLINRSLVMDVFSLNASAILVKK